MWQVTGCCAQWQTIVSCFRVSGPGFEEAHGLLSRVFKGSSSCKSESAFLYAYQWLVLVAILLRCMFYYFFAFAHMQVFFEKIWIRGGKMGGSKWMILVHVDRVGMTQYFLYNLFSAITVFEIWIKWIRSFYALKVHITWIDPFID